MSKPKLFKCLHRRKLSEYSDTILNLQQASLATNMLFLFVDCRSRKFFRISCILMKTPASVLAECYRRSCDVSPSKFAKEGRVKTTCRIRGSSQHKSTLSFRRRAVNARESSRGNGKGSCLNELLRVIQAIRRISGREFIYTPRSSHRHANRCSFFVAAVGTRDGER